MKTELSFINIKNFLSNNLSSIKPFLTCILSSLRNDNNSLYLLGMVINKNGIIKHNNWGDDINYFFISAITRKKIILYPTSKIGDFLNIEHYLCIGSSITFYSLKNTIIWGAGLINDKVGYELKSKPKKIVAVRGPLTRQWLLDQGISCPEVYGDPALLLPKYYTPKVKKRGKIGIIPHYKDINNPLVKRLLGFDNIELIKVRDYNKWTDFIDQINGCDYVISSSLHGLIVSEAYGVPNIWVEFDGENYVLGWDFKFLDFYASIGKDYVVPYLVKTNTNIDDLRKVADEWKQGNINLTGLIKSCPFELHLNRNKV